MSELTQRPTFWEFTKRSVRNATFDFFAPLIPLATEKRRAQGPPASKTPPERAENDQHTYSSKVPEENTSGATFSAWSKQSNLAELLLRNSLLAGAFREIQRPTSIIENRLFEEVHVPQTSPESRADYYLELAKKACSVGDFSKAMDWTTKAAELVSKQAALLGRHRP